MAKVANKDTAAELAVRRALHRRGFRYRVNQPIAGMGRTRPDLVFPRERIAIFIDGCFWHGCPEHATFPQANALWWAEKLDRNKARDKKTDLQLGELGWEVVRIWEHVAAHEAADLIQEIVMKRRTHRILSHPVGRLTDGDRE
jgi:DNA mismatch endonuclease (patch repair protein)